MEGKFSVRILKIKDKSKKIKDKSKKTKVGLSVKNLHGGQI